MKIVNVFNVRFALRAHRLKMTRYQIDSRCVIRLPETCACYYCVRGQGRGKKVSHRALPRKPQKSIQQWN